jgi:hypothetical protein
MKMFLELSFPNLQHILRAKTKQVKNKRENSEGKVLFNVQAFFMQIG